MQFQNTLALRSRLQPTVSTIIAFSGLWSLDGSAIMYADEGTALSRALDYPSETVFH